MSGLVKNIKLITALIVISSCGGGDNSPKINFMDQNLQGAVGGDSWQLVSGTSEVSVFDATKLSIDMTDGPLQRILFRWFEGFLYN